MTDGRKGIRMQIVSSTRIDVVVQNANAAADQIEEAHGHVYCYEYVPNGDRHHVIVTYLPDVRYQDEIDHILSP